MLRSAAARWFTLVCLSSSSPVNLKPFTFLPGRLVGPYVLRHSPSISYRFPFSRLTVDYVRPFFLLFNTIYTQQSRCASTASREHCQTVLVMLEKNSILALRMVSEAAALSTHADYQSARILSPVRHRQLKYPHILQVKPLHDRHRHQFPSFPRLWQLVQPHLHRVPPMCRQSPPQHHHNHRP